MRKLKIQMQLTLDGYVVGPNGEMDWMVWNWDEELKNYVAHITEPIDSIVLGRNLAEGFIPHWAGVAANPDDPEYAAGRKFTDTPKVVFSKTLDASKWTNTVVANGDLVQEINNLKNRDGKDIISYGGAQFASSLIQNNLIDEYHLFINPVAIGKGLCIFKSVLNPLNLQLIHARSFDCGIVVLCYTPDRK